MLLPAQQPPSSLGPSIWSLPSSSLQISQISMRSNKSSISPVSVRRGRPPPRPLRLPQHRCPALLPQPQGFSDGPENGLSSTRPSSQPGCRVSAPGDRFWRRRTPHSTCEMEVGAMEARGSFCFDRPESLCTRVLDPPGSPHAELWAQGTPCGRGRPPPRPLRLPQHRCPALLPQPQGFSDGPENGLSSTRPSSQPGCRVSAPGDRFWRRRTPHST